MLRNPAAIAVSLGCEQAGAEAGTDPAAVARYLDAAAKRKSEVAASFVPSSGYRTPDGRNSRFYGWTLTTVRTNLTPLSPSSAPTTPPGSPATPCPSREAC